MSEDAQQEDKTEEATPRRQEQAREKGQVVRSRDFSTMVVLTVSAVYFMGFGKSWYESFHHIFQRGFSPAIDWRTGEPDLIGYAMALAREALLTGIPFMICLFGVIFCAGFVIGGWNFSLDAIGFQWSRLNPIQGLARIFSMHAVVELIKSCLKLGLLAVFVGYFIYWNQPEILSFAEAETAIALAKAMQWVLHGFLLMGMVLVGIVVIDVPWQWWDHAKKLRMTFQEIRDEYKEMEGNPEVKRKLREMQRAASRKKMWEEIPTADVIITNPTHYAVAIRYRQLEDAAPVVVAKGQDLIAQQIRTIASAHHIPIIGSPALARALYHHTPIDEPIPQGLYTAVAQVLAYVYALKRFQKGRGLRPKMPGEPQIPPDLRRDG